MRFFSDEIIDKIAVLSQESKINPRNDKFMGIDVARMGGDETVLLSVERIQKKRLKMIDLEIPEAQRLTDTARLIIHKDRGMNHKKIYIDDGGMGVGVYDILFEDRQTKRKVVAINNARRSIDKEQGKENPRKKVLLKEDLYNNLKNLMENGLIELFDDQRVKQSLRSIQYENTLARGLKIYGNYSHIAEALIRAVWCIKDKSLNLYIY